MISLRDFFFHVIITHRLKKAAESRGKEDDQ